MMIDTWSEYAVMVGVIAIIAAFLGPTQYETWRGSLIAGLLAAISAFAIMAYFGHLAWPQ
jgi:hypothetical protein